VDLLQKFEQHLIDNLPKSDTFHPHFQSAMRQMLSAGGKRFRPMLLLSVINSKEPLLIDSALDVALGVEYLHTYSLIHDDLPAMDNAPLRRGHQTLHITYDEATAILVGDALNTESFKIIANAPLSSDIKIECIKALSSDGGLDGMVIGQAIDLYFEQTPISLDKLKILHINKTAKLIASSLKIGAIIAGYNNSITNRLYDFGIKLGLLFQMQDDIIDETQDEISAGKTTGNDSDKNSFVNLLGLDEAIKQTDKLSAKLHKEFQSFDAILHQTLEQLLNRYLFRHQI